MAKFVIFKGEARNQGRFGWITPGTPLVMTDAEWEGVKDSKDFSYNPNPEKVSDDPNVAHQSDPKVIDALELREKSAEQLLAYLDQLKSEGVVIQVDRNAPRTVIIRAIEMALAGAVTEDESDESKTAHERARVLASRELFIDGLNDKTTFELARYAALIHFRSLSDDDLHKAATHNKVAFGEETGRDQIIRDLMEQIGPDELPAREEVIKEIIANFDEANGIDAEALEKAKAEQEAQREASIQALRDEQTAKDKSKAQAERAAAEAKAKEEQPVKAEDVPPSNAEAIKLNGKTKPQLIEIYTATFGEAPEPSLTKAELVIALVEKSK